MRTLNELLLNFSEAEQEQFAKELESLLKSNLCPKGHKLKESSEDRLMTQTNQGDRNRCRRSYEQRECDSKIFRCE